MSAMMPKPPKPPLPPPPPPSTPLAVDASVLEAGQTTAKGGYTSMVSTTPTGLTRKASTGKTSLLGGQ